ncbi:MAG: hypothetical protein IMZ64_03000 [Bacteroidetes bacterium]|nr:hypothetical protein [Bacteroidota bacterium]
MKAYEIQYTKNFLNALYQVLEDHAFAIETDEAIFIFSQVTLALKLKEMKEREKKNGE